MSALVEQQIKPYHQTDRFSLFCGDCREALRDLADCSVDSIVCDPPYELGFMGKGWDRSGIAYDVNVWSECLRVLKPGGHLLAFGGSRTYHRLACAIEDAGFEIRDQIQWLYGSGFPKSLDVSKSIDAAAGAEREVIGLKMRPDGKSAIDCRPHGFPGEHEGWDRPWKHDQSKVELQASITAPATDSARQWNGWGTALKPAHEPIVLARKPLIGTVAENVLQHGTGGLNIDGCRIKTNDDLNGGTYRGASSSVDGTSQSMSGRLPNVIGKEFVDPLGRWPSNVIHDGSDEVLAAFPDAPGQQGDLSGHSKDRLSKGIFGDMKSARDAVARLDSGSAARFFYCAKAN